MLQWRNRLARGTYTAVSVRNAEVVSSSLTWNNVFIPNLRNHFSIPKKYFYGFFLQFHALEVDTEGITFFDLVILYG